MLAFVFFCKPHGFYFGPIRVRCHQFILSDFIAAPRTHKRAPLPPSRLLNQWLPSKGSRTSDINYSCNCERDSTEHSERKFKTDNTDAKNIAQFVSTPNEMRINLLGLLWNVGRWRSGGFAHVLRRHKEFHNNCKLFAYVFITSCFLGSLLFDSDLNRRWILFRWLII